MNDISESLQQVTQSPNFWFYMGLIVSLGMVIGAKLNEGLTGLKRSLLILIPFVLLLTLTNLSRVYYYSLQYGMGAQSYNNTIALALTATAYCSGLVLGHLIVAHAVRSALKNEDIEKLPAIKL